MPLTIDLKDLKSLDRENVSTIARLMRQEMTIETVNGHLPVYEWWQSGDGLPLYIHDTQDRYPWVSDPMKNKDFTRLRELIHPDKREAFVEWVNAPSPNTSSFFVTPVRWSAVPPGPGNPQGGQPETRESETRIYRESFFQATPLTDMKGHNLGFWFRVFPLEHKSTEDGQDSLRGQLHMINGLFNAIPIGVMVLNQGGELLLINNHLQRTAGIQKYSIYDLSLADLFEPETREILRTWYENPVNAESAKPTPALIRRSGKEPLITLLTPFLVRQPGTESILAVLVSEADDNNQAGHHKEILVAQLHNLYENMAEFFRLYTSQLSWKKSYNAPEFGLTNKEKDVIKYTLEGLSNRDISQRMNIADVTVRKHLTHVYKKLGVTNRYELLLRFK